MVQILPTFTDACIFLSPNVPVRTRVYTGKGNARYRAQEKEDEYGTDAGQPPEPVSVFAYDLQNSLRYQLRSSEILDFYVHHT